MLRGSWNELRHVLTIRGLEPLHDFRNKGDDGTQRAASVNGVDARNL